MTYPLWYTQDILDYRLNAELLLGILSGIPKCFSKDTLEYFSKDTLEYNWGHMQYLLLTLVEYGHLSGCPLTGETSYKMVIHAKTN